MSLPSALLAIASACLLAPVSVGCQMGGHGQAVAHHPAYEQLEQGCFGYEPTVWRNMPGDCQQAVRMIPNEIVQLPETKAAQEPSPADMTAPPKDGEEGEQPEQMLNVVPDSSPLDLPRIVQPDALPETPIPETPIPETPIPETPVPETPVPETPVPETPVPETPVPESPVVPPAEPPAAEPPVAVPPAVVPEKSKPAPSPNQGPPVSRAGVQSLPVITGPARQSGSVSAQELFRTISEALNETARPQVATRRAKPPVEGSLSRFISY